MLDEKRILAYELLAPYFIDPATCGRYNGLCAYDTPDGRRCIAGKCMIEPEKFSITSYPIMRILERDGQSAVFLPEYVDKFTNDEWADLQDTHDAVAVTSEVYNNSIFDMKEFKAYCTEKGYTISPNVKFYEEC